MNEMQKDNFDMLISAAVVQCVHHDADALSSVDVSEVPDTSRLYKKVMRNLPSSRRTAVKAIVTLVLAAALLALTACACLPEVREYVWGVVTEWYGDHFEVSFEQESTFVDDVTTSVSEIEPPTYLEEIASLGYIPEGCVIDDEMTLSSHYSANYYLNGEWAFYFSQSLYDVTDSFLDGEDVTVIRIDINGNTGVLIEQNDDYGVIYNLLWQDGRYRYNLQGTFTSFTEIVKIAENIVLNK